MKRNVFFMLLAFVFTANLSFAGNDNEIVNQTEMLPIEIESFANAPDKEKENLIQQFILTNKKYFKKSDLLLIQSQLKELNEEQLQGLLMLEEFMDPTANVIISVLVGNLGIDRFVIGQVGYGVLKLVTLGGLGVWTIVDWFQISGITKKHNAEVLMESINTLKVMSN